MQEEVENRTVNLAISTTKLTGRSLVNAFRAYLNHRRNAKARKASIQDAHIVGEQTIDQLLGQNQGATNAVALAAVPVLVAHGKAGVKGCNFAIISHVHNLLCVHVCVIYT